MLATLTVIKSVRLAPSKMFRIINQHFTRILPRKSYDVRLCSTNNKKNVPKNLLAGQFSAIHQENGAVYDKKPFKITLKAGVVYGWCLCGKSKNQPLCDGTHKDIFLKIKHRPINFKVEETKEYWLCNCKQTSHRPFCDGTHKKDEIQSLNIRHK